jgi:hypothetical protein
METHGNIQKVTHGMILLDDIWKIIMGRLLAYQVMTCGNILLGDSSLLTGHTKLLLYSTIFQGLNHPSSIIPSLLVFLAKYIKHSVLYILKNIISQ